MDNTKINIVKTEMIYKNVLINKKIIGITKKYLL